MIEDCRDHGAMVKWISECFREGDGGESPSWGSQLSSPARGPSWGQVWPVVSSESPSWGG